MRLIFLSLLFALSLQAKEATCYTVQLFSAINNETNSKKLADLEYDDECKLMEIGSSLTIRCGCYTKIKSAEDKLDAYKKKYKYAYVATTYAYRFDKEKSIKRPVEAPIIEKNTQEPVLSVQEETLKLMLQSFLYSRDLKNAYKTAKIGMKQYPHSEYWTQKMVEITEWTGKEQESMKYMMLLNQEKSTPELESKLIKKGLSAYQYEKIATLVEKKAREFPSKENDKQVTYVYSQVGTPEKAAIFFEKEYKKDTRKVQYLTEALQIYMDMGDVDSANRIVKHIEAKNLYTLESSKLIAYYYYSKHQIHKSYNVLARIHSNKGDEKYYQLKSDLGWYLKKYKPAAEASQMLIKAKQGRLVDYERVVFVKREVNPKLALQTSLEAYSKFQKSYLFYTYAYSAMDQNEYRELSKVVQEIDSKDSSLKQEANYWLIKAGVYRHNNEKEKGLLALQKALEIDPSNIQTQLTAVSMYIDYQENRQLQLVLLQLSENNLLPVAFYYPLASAYYQLQDINRASFYMDKLLQLHAPITQTVAFKFLQADLYAQRNDENAFKKTLHQIDAQLEEQKRKNPRIAKTDSFQNQYLRANIHLLSPDVFEEKLGAAKQWLTQEHYDDLSYAWATKNGAKELAHSIYQHISPKAIWLQFANAMQEQNHSEVENLLLAYLHSLSLGDASVAAHKDGQVALSQSLAYDSLSKNDDNQNAYISHMNLAKERSNRFDSKVSYYNRDPLVRKYVKLDNQLYLSKGYFLSAGVNYYKNRSADDALLINVPADTLEMNLGLKKLFDKGEIELKSGYYDAMTSYMVLEILAEYQFNKILRLYGSFSKNKNADETTQLLLGGKKDMLSLAVKLDILASSSLNILWQNNSFNSQDGVHIGDGNYARVLLGHQLRSGYPDMRVSVFGDYGKYSEKSGSKGVIDNLQVGVNPVLPKEFYNLGVDFAYGMANSAIYTRVWRPFWEVNTFYNSEIGNFSYNFNIGYGGKVFSQDHMIVGANYTESVNGVGGSVFELFLKYQFLYTHPALMRGLY